MNLKKYRIRIKIYVIMMLFLLMNIIGILYVLKYLSLEIIYQQIYSLVIVTILWGLVMFVIYRVFVAFFYQPINRIEKVLKLVSLGDLSNKTNYKSDDELGQIADSIDSIIQNQLNLSEFLEKIGDGNFNLDYTVLSDKDKLGYSITNMRDKLHKIVIEDTSRQWSTEGIAKFGALLRENNDDLKVLFDKLLSDLVKYISANQGAIFLLNDNKRDKVCLEMVSVYAWDRKKFLTKTIEFGEGLVGQAAIEKDAIYLTDVPDRYINITSGLGDSNPRSILIVPLLFNDELFGVMEFASFKIYELFEIEFVKKIAEIIAATIFRANINKQTQQLLKDSQKLTEELRTQEEEMRQNLEEMNATQEEMQQREVERIGIFTAINNTLATVEFSMDGRIINANDKYLSMMNYSLDEIEQTGFLQTSQMNQLNFTTNSGAN
jgi:PAS domain-containing protein